MDLALITASSDGKSLLKIHGNFKRPKRIHFFSLSSDSEKLQDKTKICSFLSAQISYLGIFFHWAHNLLSE